MVCCIYIAHSRGKLGVDMSSLKAINSLRATHKVLICWGLCFVCMALGQGKQGCNIGSWWARQHKAIDEANVIGLKTSQTHDP